MRAKNWSTMLFCTLCLATLLVPAAGARGRPELDEAAVPTALTTEPAVHALAPAAGVQQDGPRFASYNAAEDWGQLEVFVITAYRDFYGWNTLLSIQNLTDAAMTITVEFFEGSSTPIHQETGSVPAYSPWNLDLTDVTDLPDNWSGSATVSAVAPIAVAAVHESPSTGFLDAHNGSLMAAGELFVPLLYNDYYGWNSSMAMQNMGAVDASVLVEYSDGVSVTTYLAPYATWVLFQPSEPGHAPNSAFSAHITADQPLLAQSHYFADGVGGSMQEAFSWGGNVLAVPLTAKENAGWNSSVIVQNLGSATADVTIAYEGYAAEAYTVPIDPGAVCSFLTPNEPFLPAGYRGAARLTSDNGEPLIAQVLLANNSITAGDSRASYIVPSTEVRGAAGATKGGPDQPIVYNIFYPWAPKALSGGPVPEDVVLVVENTGATEATVLATFYDPAGNAYMPSELAGTPNPFILGARASRAITMSAIPELVLPGGTEYAAIFSADQLLAGVALIGRNLSTACDPVHDANFTWEPLNTAPGEALTLTASAAGTAPIAFAWDFGDGSTGAGETVAHTYTEAGTYTVVLTASNCLTATATAVHTITVAGCDPVQDADFTWEPLTPAVGATFTLTASAGGTAPIDFLWYFGDGYTGTGRVIAHAYFETGTYTIVLTASNGCGEDGASHAITVVLSPKYQAYLPLVCRDYGP